MLLKLLQCSRSFLTWGVILLEDSYSSWEDRRRVRGHQIRNYFQKNRSFHGLFYDYLGSKIRPCKCLQKHNTATNNCLWPAVEMGEDVCLKEDVTWCDDRRHEWEVVILLRRTLSKIYYWSSLNIPGHTVGLVVADAWLTALVKCTVPFPIASHIKTWVQKHLYQDVHCIELSSEQLCDTSFALPYRIDSDILFLRKHGSPMPWRLFWFNGLLSTFQKY